MNETATTTTKSVNEVVKMFGEIDCQANGSISSEYPAWVNKVHMSNLKEDIRSIEQQLKMSLIPHDKVYNERQRLEMLKNKLHTIEESKPHVSDGEKGRLMKMYKHFGSEITLLLPTRAANLKGLSNPHAELDLMQKPCIKVPGEFTGQVLAMGIAILGEKISRNAAAKVWKIIGSLVGEPTNIEHLRKD